MKTVNARLAEIKYDGFVAPLTRRALASERVVKIEREHTSGASLIKTNRRNVPRIAASSYLNTAPLIWSFRNGSMRNLVELDLDAAPARCADLLASGRADAALVPVIEYARMSNVVVVPGVCVGARRRVRSVVLVTQRARLEEINSIALDESSRTSAALVQIIFREFLQRAPVFAPSSPDLDAMLANFDAALLIGDPAMTIRRKDVKIFDLAALWREHTGLGFVFALWMLREEKAEVLQTIDWAKARDEGLQQAAEIAALYEDKLKLPRAMLEEYLRENICYELDKELQAGLSLFYQLAQKHGLIPARQDLQLPNAHIS